MTTYTYAQLEGLWINNGGSSATAPIAAAIAEAESSGNADATSSNPDGGTNVGLWQLDTPGGVGAGNTVAQLQDPNTNASVAVKGSSNGTNWGPWATFASGAYKAFLNAGTTPDTSVPGGSGASSASTTASTTSADCLLAFPGVSVPIAGSVGGFCMLSKSEARAMIGALCLAAGGLAFVIGALVVAAGAIGDTKVGQAATSAAGKAASVVPFIPI